MEEDYSKGKIYKLVSKHTDKFYIGSTTQALKYRLSKHYSDYKRFLNGLDGYCYSFKLLELGDCRIELVEDYPCASREQLRKREGFHMLQNLSVCVNHNIAGRTTAEWKQDNKKRVQEQSAEYYRNNLEEFHAYRTKYKE